MYMKLLQSLGGILVCALGWAPLLTAQMVDKLVIPHRHICHLPAVSSPIHIKIPPPSYVNQLRRREKSAMFSTDLSTEGTVFGYNCTSWPSGAEAALNEALRIWSSILDSQNTINLRACWSDDMPAASVASGGPTLIRVTEGMASTYYPLPLWESTNANVNGTNSDMRLVVNSARDFYTGTDGNPGGSQIDLVSVLLHEIAHGLGFLSVSDYNDAATGEDECAGGAGSVDGDGCLGFYVSADDTHWPDIFSRFIETGDGTSITAYDNPSDDIGDAIQGAGSDIYFNSAAIRAENGGDPAELYTPSNYVDGSSVSHFSTTFSSELMEPAILIGSAIHDPGLAVPALLSLGWPEASALPVELIAFDAFGTNDNVTLEWVTTNEMDNKGFVVERSKNGIDWREIGFVAGRNVSERSNYRFVDQRPYPGTNYYRLEQQDFSGTSSISSIKTVRMDFRGKALLAYPIPASDEMMVEALSLNLPQPYWIVDVQGRIVGEGIVEEPYQSIKLIDLPAGLYTLVIGEKALGIQSIRFAVK